MMRGWYRDNYRHSLAARRIKTKIPPAWKNVKHYTDKEYIVTGVDKKGRTQYIYPESFKKQADKDKYKRIEALDKQIPSIMEEVKDDIKDGSPEAEAVYTIYKTGFRPGTEKDTLADEQAYGVSTLEPKHIKIKGDTVYFKFIGKKGVQVEKKVRDRVLVSILKRRAAKGEQIFPVSDSQMRSYFDGLTNGRFKLKDLRTLRAHRLAKQSDGNKKEIAKAVSADLGNTPAVAIKSYVDPRFLS